MKNKIYDDIDYLFSVVPRRDKLVQLAEECCELGQAALKLTRALDTNGSPTPVSAEKAEQALLEEVADVLLCLQVSGYLCAAASRPRVIGDIETQKAARWVRRIKEKEDMKT